MLLWIGRSQEDDRGLSAAAGKRVTAAAVGNDNGRVASDVGMAETVGMHARSDGKHGRVLETPYTTFWKAAWSCWLSMRSIGKRFLGRKSDVRDAEWDSGAAAAWSVEGQLCTTGF